MTGSCYLHIWDGSRNKFYHKTCPNSLHTHKLTHKNPYINAIYIAILKYLALYKKADLHIAQAGEFTKQEI